MSIEYHDNSVGANSLKVIPKNFPYRSTVGNCDIAKNVWMYLIQNIPANSIFKKSIVVKTQPNPIPTDNSNQL